jgi:protein TonB
MGGSSAAALAAPPPPPPAAPVRVGGEIQPPSKVKHVDPVYPQVARAAKISGIVIVDATIDRDGNVRDAKVLRGQALLNQAALDAISQWKFTPTMLNQQPVEVLMTVTVNFTLQ